MSVFGKLQFYSLLKVLLTRCCDVAFGSVALLVSGKPLICASYEIGFLASTSVRGSGNTKFSEP